MLHDAVARSFKRIAILAGASLVAALLVTPSSARADTQSGLIASGGPLEKISISPTLSCDVRYAGDDDPEFYGGDKCGTAVAVDGVVYGPSSLTGWVDGLITFTPIDQEVVTGAGTIADPFKQVTRVKAGELVSVEQTDSYVAGAQSYRTSIVVSYDGDAPKDLKIYRAADCYLGNSDFGTAEVHPDRAVCVGTGGRQLQLIDASGRSETQADRYGTIWDVLATGESFNNQALQGDSFDNGMGLSWSRSLAGGESVTIESTINFTSAGGVDPADLADLDGDALPDIWETDGVPVEAGGPLDLAAMGASPEHKDILIHVDFIESMPAYAKRDAIQGMTKVRQLFADSPVLNIDGTRGINVHIDCGGQCYMNSPTATLDDLGETTRWGSRSESRSLDDNGRGYSWSPTSTAYCEYTPYWEGEMFDPLTLRFECLEPTGSASEEMMRSLDSTHRLQAFRYALVTDSMGTSESSGSSSAVFPDDLGDTDASSDTMKSEGFIVAAGTDGDWLNRVEFAGTFMHELGHSLGLWHGGLFGPKSLEQSAFDCKTNYESVMSYYYQLSGIALGYSNHAEPTVPRSSEYLCGEDWPERVVGEGTFEDLEAWEGSKDWGNLQFDGGSLGQLGAPVFPAPDADPAPFMVEPSYDELSVAADGDLSGSLGDVTAKIENESGSARTLVLSVPVTNSASSAGNYLINTSSESGDSTIEVEHAVDGTSTSTAIVRIPLGGAALSEEFDVSIILSSQDHIELSRRDFSFQSASLPIVGGSESTPDPSPGGGGTLEPVTPAADVQRLAGDNRYETAVEISKAAFSNGGAAAASFETAAAAGVEAVFISTGTDFPDGLAGGPSASKLGAPLLLTKKSSLPAVVSEEIKRLDPQSIYILGGTGVVSAGVESALQKLTDGKVTRLAGPNRYATAAKASTLWTSTETVYLASGLMFADALSGGAAAAREGAPLLLTKDKSLPVETVAALKRLDPSKIVLVGGTGAISDAVKAAVADAVPGATITREWGQDRYGTSAELLRSGTTGPISKLMLASGLNFPDALAGIPASIAKGAAFAITKTACLASSVKAALGSDTIAKYFLLGGKAVLADTVTTEVCP